MKFRDENGKIKERKELLKVPTLGKAAFEQCAGFIRVLDVYKRQVYGSTELVNFLCYVDAY